jgi:hypothetical protein
MHWRTASPSGNSMSLQENPLGHGCASLQVPPQKLPEPSPLGMQ